MGRNTSRHSGEWDDARSVEGASCSAWGTVAHRVVAEPPHCRLGEMMPFLVTRNAKSLVFLNFEFQKPTDGDAQAMPFENTEAQESAVGLEIRIVGSCLLGMRVGVGKGIPGTL